MIRPGLLLSLLLSAPALAAQPDYATNSEEWNGMSTLVALASERGCPPIARSTLDWSAFSPNDALWVVYPRTILESVALRRFVATGGRALLADDFGVAAVTLHELGIERAPVPSLPERAYYQGIRHLPIAHRGLSTELGRSTIELVSNHPTALHSTLPATFLFDADAALVVEGRIGRGRFIALSDPSVLINNMLAVEGNRAFAEALAADSCRPGGRIFFLTGRWTSSGHPPGDDLAPADRLNGLALQLNAELAQIGQDPSSVSILGCTLVLVLGLVAVHAAAKPPPFEPFFAALVNPEAERKSRGEAALALLKEEVASRIRSLVGSDVSRAAVRRALVEALGPSLGRALYQLDEDCRGTRRLKDATLLARAERLFRRLDGPSQDGAHGNAQT